MTSAGWARCTGGVADILRRGAWYAILGETGDEGVLLDVRGRPVRFSRGDLTIRVVPPTHWSVVVRAGVLRPASGGDKGRELVTSYAVCPHCAHRQDLPEGRPRSGLLTCEQCRQSSAVEWSEIC